jgi:hypothetical protein
VLCEDQLAAGCYDGWRGRESTVVYSVISSTYTIVYVHTFVRLSCLNSMTNGQYKVANDTVLYRTAKHSPRATEL